MSGDLTPDNLILQPDGALKLVDFDVAQEVMSTGGIDVSINEWCQSSIVLRVIRKNSHFLLP